MPNRNTIVLKMIKARGTILLYLVLITLLVRWGQIYGKLASAQFERQKFRVTYMYSETAGANKNDMTRYWEEICIEI